MNSKQLNKWSSIVSDNVCQEQEWQQLMTIILELVAVMYDDNWQGVAASPQSFRDERQSVAGGHVGGISGTSPAN